MFTVALIGPDGAGKTTIGRRLEFALPLPVKYLYMGVNLDASNTMLPTTRLVRAVKRACGAKPDTAGPPDPDRVRTTPRGLKGILTHIRLWFGLVNRMSEEWFRQLVAYYHQRRGCIVLFDRHFYLDYYSYDIADTGQARPLQARIHGWMLDRLYPKPDLVILLDAPAEVLYARKQEGTIAALERRRQGYFEMRSRLKHFEVVDVTQPEDAVLRDVTTLIRNFHQARTTGRTRSQDARAVTDQAHSSGN